MRKIAARLLVLVILVGVVAGGYYLVQQIPQEKEEFPLAPVRRGDLIVKTHLRGELQAVRTLSLTAPNLGSATQITQLAPSGALSATSDLIMEFDDSERQAAMEDAQLEVDRVNEQLKKAQADLEIRKSQDDVELIKARFAVRRAELEVKKNELISAIDARKNILTLEEAKRREEKLEQDIKSRLQQREAELAVLREERSKAQIDVDRERRRIDASRVLSPMSGLVSILQNRAGGRGGFGQTTPDIQEGDQIPAGMEVAKILDLSEMELLAKVEERERANLHEGQEAIVRLDALPGKEVKAKVKRLGNTASSNVFAGEATKKFDAVLSIDMRQLLTHVGAKPEQVERILAKSRENALRTQSASGRGRAGGGEAPVGAGFGGGRPAGRGGPGRGSGPSAFGGFGGGPPRAAGGPGGRGQSARGGPGDTGGRGGGQGGFGQGGRGRGQRAGTAESGQSGPGAGASGEGQQGREARRGGRGGGQGGQFSEQDRQRARQRMQQLLGGRDIQSLSQEERQRIFQQMRQSAQGGGAGRGGGAGGPGAGGPRGGFGGPGGPAGGGAAGGRSGAAGLVGPAGGDNRAGGGGTRQFTKQQRDNAQLPQPPTEGSDVDVLLRPGLLADAEIIVDKIQNTLYVPFQGIFEVSGNPVVYVWDGSGVNVRRVDLGKRSESQIAILSGLEEGELIALQPPGAQGRQSGTKKKVASGAQPSFPGAGGPPGGGGGRPGGGGGRQGGRGGGR